MDSQTAINVAWRRLDIPGHDAATLLPSGDGWDLEGAAVLVRHPRIIREIFSRPLNPALR
jgi:hypothetical protein